MGMFDAEFDWERVKKIVVTATGIVVSPSLTLRCFNCDLKLQDAVEDLADRYSFPKDPASGYYLETDREILLGTFHKDGMVQIVCLHEVFHDIFLHNLTKKQKVAIHRAIGRNRRHVQEAYETADVPQPWRIEERACDLFAFGLCRVKPMRYLALAKCYTDLLAPIIRRQAGQT